MLSLKLPQIFRKPHAIAANAAGAKMAGPPSPKGRPQIGRDHAKIAPPAQRRGKDKSSIFGKVVRQKLAVILEMAVGQVLKRDLASLRVQESRGEGSPDHGANRRQSHPHTPGIRGEGWTVPFRDRA